MDKHCYSDELQQWFASGLRRYEKHAYGRMLGDIYLNARWINKKLVVEGGAWHVRYSKLVRKHPGLWVDEKALPLAEWRKKR
ncbi:MAG: thermonuclease family protein [Planctomycetes bacterium]|nr:thermonuclease family protein [Planctomycetota bacterium]